MITRNKIHVRVDFTTKGEIIPLAIIDKTEPCYIRKINYCRRITDPQGKDIIIEFGIEINDGRNKVIYFNPSDFV